MYRFPILALSLLALCGCVAVWGQPFDIQSKSSDAITLKYDRNFTDAAEMDRIAQAHCDAYDGKAVKRDEATSMWNLTTVTYDCRPS